MKVRYDFAFDAELWRWQGATAAAWHFVTLPQVAAVEIRLRTIGKRRGWGSVRVKALIGETRWLTSIFPQPAADSYLLPVKSAVRKAEGISEGDTVAVELALIED